MDLNADFAQRAAVHASTLPWTPSPIPGVERRMLDRIGGEVARATTIVRYAPASTFSPHTHGGGEEFLILDGVFQDEHGDYPTGSYVRNPPTTSHTPRSGVGCTLLVKLWQFDPSDRTRVKIATRDAPFAPMDARAGVTHLPLFEDAHETVRIERWAPAALVVLDLPAGGEFFVLDGGFHDGIEAFAPQSWLRLPAASTLTATAGPNGCSLWVKTGHLGQASIAV